jgi:acetyltransferase
MTTRNFDYLLKPRSVALIGASDEPQSIGAVLASNLLSADFKGPIYLVNPKHKSIGSIRVYPNIAAAPSVPDLVVVATPSHTVPGIIAEIAGAGTKAAIVITAGFGESTQDHSRGLRQQMLDAARPSLLRIIGPNCLGMMVPDIGLNASFAHTMANPGRLAFIAQSGAIVTSVLDWAATRGVGFSHLVSLGNMSDVDFGDMLDYLASDPGTKAILLYIESISHARKFMSAARAAARSKPVIVVKAGRHAEGARAAASHTGALAGLDEVYDAAIRRAGMLRVHTLNELFDATESLAAGRLPEGADGRLVIVTNGGGIGVLATDALMDNGGCLAPLSNHVMSRLNEVLPPTWSHANPIDIVGDATGSRYVAVLEVLQEDADVDGVLVLNCPTAVASGIEAAGSVIEAIKRHHLACVLTSWVGEKAAVPARRLFGESRIPTYDTPEQAVSAFMHMVHYRQNQELLIQTPPSMPEAFSPDFQTARAQIGRALHEKREWLTEPEAKLVLSAYGIPCVPTLSVTTPEEAAQATRDIGDPVALKILSPDITHKSDVGGVILDLEHPDQVRQAAEAMLQRIQMKNPEADIEGFTVQPMVRRAAALELILGVIEDPQFGPVILFGHGGTAVEVINDKTVELPPLNMRLARRMIERTQVWKLLQGYRNQPAADLASIELTLVKLSQLIIELGEIVELDINPLYADANGVIALDARIKIRPVGEDSRDRLAIRPYPKELEETVPLGDGRALLLRPIAPEDEPSIQRAFSTLTREEIRLRFFAPIKVLSHITAARFTQIDYDREMALILTENGIPGETDIHGVVRIFADPNNERAEFALIVHHDMTGLGLGIFLMRRIIDYARDRRIGEIYGDVLSDNRAMLKLCKFLGFDQSYMPDDPGVFRVSLRLDESNVPG